MKTHWWLHLILDGWLQTVALILLLWGVFSLKKNNKLERDGKLTKGLVIDKYASKDPHTESNDYIIKYIYTDHDQTTNSLLIHGYINKNTDIHIPTSIIGVISSFHGLCSYDRSSIIDQQTLDEKHWSNVQIGDKIDILFDPNHPKIIKLPTMLMKYGSKQKRIIWTGCIIFITLLLLWYYYGITEYTPENIPMSVTVFVTLLVFLTYFINSLAVVSIFYGCYMLYRFRIHLKINSSFAHAKYRQVYNIDDKDSESEGCGEDMVIHTTS